nr:MAG TPA: hypothetical protein [Caudoviricetes sp.]
MRGCLSGAVPFLRCRGTSRRQNGTGGRRI